MVTGLGASIVAAPLGDTRYVPLESPCVEEFTPWYGYALGYAGVALSVAAIVLWIWAQRRRTNSDAHLRQHQQKAAVPSCGGVAVTMAALLMQSVVLAVLYSGQGMKVADPRIYHTQNHPDCYTGTPVD